MEYKTADGYTVTDEALEAEAELFEEGGRPEGWGAAKPVNVTLPAWVIAAADTEAKRINVSRRAILNMWLATMAEKSARKSARQDARLVKA